jgi:AN1-type zinc finger protein 5/6
MKPAYCVVCHKKLGLTGIQCRCGNYYCGIHRYPEEHNCTFKWRDYAQSLLAKMNKKVAPKKLETID